MPPSTAPPNEERDHREVGTRTTGRRRRDVLVDRSRTRAGLGGVRGRARPIRTEARIGSAALVVALAQSSRLAAEALELRCRVEADPSDALEPDLHPGMRGLEGHRPTGRVPASHRAGSRGRSASESPAREGPRPSSMRSTSRIPSSRRAGTRPPSGRRRPRPCRSRRRTPAAAPGRTARGRRGRRPGHAARPAR